MLYSQFGPTRLTEEVIGAVMDIENFMVNGLVC